MEGPRVLVVEDDKSLVNLITRGLERVGCEVESTHSSVDAILMLQQGRFSVLLLDIMLSGSSGMYVIDALRDIPTEVRPRVIVMTGARANVLGTIDRNVVRAILFKPLDVPSLAAFVKAMGDPTDG